MEQKNSGLIAPHGGRLVDLAVHGEALKEALSHVGKCPSLQLNKSQLIDLELLCEGALSPLDGFADEQTYRSILEHSRLPNGVFWPLPILLKVSEPQLKQLDGCERIVLHDLEFNPVALLDLTEVYRHDEALEAHALECEVPMTVTAPWSLAGRITCLGRVRHADFPILRRGPHRARCMLSDMGANNALAFITEGLITLPKRHFLTNLMQRRKTHVLVQAIHDHIDLTDRGHFSRVRSCASVLGDFPAKGAMLNLIPYRKPLYGVRSAQLHGIIHKNFGCNLVCLDSEPLVLGEGMNDCRAFARAFAAAGLRSTVGVDVLDYQHMGYDAQSDTYDDARRPGVLDIPSSALRDILRRGQSVPEWLLTTEARDELQQTYPARHRTGFTVFFTGLSGAGKSTLAKSLVGALMEKGGRPVTLLDGDVVRHHLSSELGFSKAHRDLNITRIGFVASEITKNGGIAVCAPIAPYRDVRAEVRSMISQHGGFVEVHVCTPLDVCERRDKKGLYAKARKGLIKGFTGVDDPYEAPEYPEVSVNTEDLTVQEGLQRILDFLGEEGYLLSK